MRAENRIPVIASVALLVLLLLSVWMIRQYIDQEHSRDLQRWQDRLSVIAETKKRAVEGWLKNQQQNLEELASNPLLQITLSIPQQGAPASEVAKGQAGHLRNLIIATARRAGVFSPTPIVNANQSIGNADGIAIVSKDMTLRMSTRGFPGMTDLVRRAVVSTLGEQRAVVLGIEPDSEGEPRLVIVVPVRSVQSTELVGAVVALIDPTTNLYEVVADQWLTTSSDESNLVIGDEASTTYITPLDEDYPLFHQVPMASEDNAANFARTAVGDFAERTDYDATRVLVTSRKVADTSWVLVQKIDEEEALSESRAHREFIFTVFLLVSILLAITFVAVWRHSTSLRLRRVTDSLSERTELLNTVTDNINDKLFMLDGDDRLVFINRALADEASTGLEDVAGKQLNHVFSREIAARLLEIDAQQGVTVCELEVAGNTHLYHVAVARLASGRHELSRLFVLHDITELHEAEQKHTVLLEGIITTLVRITDMHDPHCMNHSERTRDVAIAIARAMELDEDAVETLSMASLLANIGKLKLPRELLTKMEPLTPEEEAEMREAMEYTISILESLAFDGPVVEVIRQKNENLDGSGYPQGLTADAIRTESRILAVANAFVAMCSARAYREGMPVRDALDILYAESDARYDREVTAALMHVAAKHDDWARWQNVR